MIGARERIAIAGDNGSGKTTLIKAILADSTVKRTGSWNMPKPQDIGYLDQHYSTLSSALSAFEIIETRVPEWTIQDIRAHLNDFLFRKNEEIMLKVQHLSGGERARLSLAHIAAKSPKLLILDEITNNLDLETREHVIQVIKDYPGAMIVISHDADFLKQIHIDTHYGIAESSLRMQVREVRG
jgi:ATPase subunit of ABC transporter with duplicated ATPase domains